MYDGEISRDGEAGGPGWEGVWEARTSGGMDLLDRRFFAKVSYLLSV